MPPFGGGHVEWGRAREEHNGQYGKEYSMGGNAYSNSDYQGNNDYQWTKGYPGVYQMGVPMAGQEYSSMVRGGRYGTLQDGYQGG